MRKLQTEWSYGQKAELARRTGIAPSYLTAILKGSVPVNAKLAKKLSKEAKGLGLKLSRDDLLYPDESENPLLKT